MGPSLLPNPSTANLTEALSLVRSVWAPVVDQVARGQSSFWLGSAISAARFDRLDALLLSLLERLQAKLNGANTCPYRKALNQIIQQTTIDPTTVDFTQAPKAWPSKDVIIAQLCNQYSKILGIPVFDSKPLSIPWDILKLQNTYANAAIEPDAEHRCLAVMIEEGFINNLVTTNWDPLIEKAYQECRGTKATELEIVACNDDLSLSHGGRAPRLLKIHSCAKKSVDDPGKYQPFMVATVDEIAKWNLSASALAEAAQALLRRTPALFVGLSGQDFNLQTLFANIQAGRTEPFPPAPPRVIFTTKDLSPDHYAILKLLYGEAVYMSNAEQLDKVAALPLYAKPLLSALYLLGIKQKLCVLLQLGKSEMLPAFLSMATGALEFVEQDVCKSVDAISTADERWRTTIQNVTRYISRLMSLYQKQELGPVDSYEPIANFNIAKIESQNPAVSGNLHWLFLAMACIVEGSRKGYWTIELSFDSNPATGQILLQNGGNTIALFLIDRAMYLPRLEKRALSIGATTHRVVILYPADTVPAASTRFPGRSLPGATHDPDELTELSLQELLDGTSTVDELLDSLRKELI